MVGRLSTVTRISLGLACLTLSLLFLASGLKLVPNERTALLQGRQALCETIALYASQAAARGDLHGIEQATWAVVRRNADVLSAAVRRADGQLMLQTEEHETLWTLQEDAASTATQVRVPILRDGGPWGSIEVCFVQPKRYGIASLVTYPVLALGGFLCISSFAAFLIYLRRTLQYLDPSAVIPERVKRMLDTLAEGVLVLDEKQRVVLANRSFGTLLGVDAGDLLGSRPAALPWVDPATGAAPASHPWEQVLQDQQTLTGVVLRMQCRQDLLTFRINSAAIVGGDGKVRGALVTFDDITQIEEQNAQLDQMLQTLEQSRDEIDRQNRELRLLATTDPLTGWLNRRAFFERLDSEWAAARRNRRPISCVMVDVDHFKPINDRYGHAMGDRVLQEIAAVMKRNCRDIDLLCRYGGEEFCILLPGIDLDQAMEAAEGLRVGVARHPVEGIEVTVSVGVSGIRVDGSEPQQLLDLADQALYAAKRDGRNRIVRYDQMPPQEALAGFGSEEGPTSISMNGGRALR